MKPIKLTPKKIDAMFGDMDSVIEELDLMLGKLDKWLAEHNITDKDEMDVIKRMFGSRRTINTDGYGVGVK